MRRYPYETVNVFSVERFGGNPLAVVLDADTLTAAEMQALAAEFNFSETAFVLTPRDPRHSAWVRIFNRTAEMAFAGHPNVGTALVLAGRGRADGDTLRFEEAAGLVEIQLVHDASGRRAARVVAPQPLSLGEELTPEAVARCVALEAGEIVTGTHAPTMASVGMPFVLVEVAPAALSRAVPSLAIFLYTRDGSAVRARMFSPIAGTYEDPATGSASAALAALLLARSTSPTLELTITQGVEMGRRSVLEVRGWREGTGIRASVQGGCVHAARGEVAV